MNKNLKGLITVLIVGGGVYLAYKYLVNPFKYPDIETMRNEFWDNYVATFPAVKDYKNQYMSTGAFKDDGFIKAWYKASKKNEKVFKYQDRLYRTKDAMGI